MVSDIQPSTINSPFKANTAEAISSSSIVQDERLQRQKPSSEDEDNVTIDEFHPPNLPTTNVFPETQRHWHQLSAPISNPSPPHPTSAVNPPRPPKSHNLLSRHLKSQLEVLLPRRLRKRHIPGPVAHPEKQQIHLMIGLFSTWTQTWVGDVNWNDQPCHAWAVAILKLKRNNKGKVMIIYDCDPRLPEGYHHHDEANSKRQSR
ncbi:hypothetical protein BDV12DRAFT_28664 [Aspergillus spectabilis]